MKSSLLPFIPWVCGLAVLLLVFGIAYVWTPLIAAIRGFRWQIAFALTAIYALSLIGCALVFNLWAGLLDFGCFRFYYPKYGLPFVWVADFYADTENSPKFSASCKKYEISITGTVRAIDSK